MDRHQLSSLNLDHLRSKPSCQPVNSGIYTLIFIFFTILVSTVAGGIYCFTKTSLVSVPLGLYCVPGWLLADIARLSEVLEVLTSILCLTTFCVKARNIQRNNPPSQSNPWIMHCKNWKELSIKSIANRVKATKMSWLSQLLLHEEPFPISDNQDRASRSL